MEEQGGSGTGWLVYILIGVAIGLYLIGSPKYEGEGAEYWYDLYADYEDMYSYASGCLYEIEDIADYYSYGEDYEDMQSAFEDIEEITADCK